MENKVRIDFNEIEWSESSPGFRSKTIQLPNGRFRLVEIDEHFVEAGWCSLGHMGYVLDGTLFIRFADGTVRFSQGDGLFIEAGNASAHQAFVQAGVTARLLLFD